MVGSSSNLQFVKQAIAKRSPQSGADRVDVAVNASSSLAPSISQVQNDVEATTADLARLSALFYMRETGKLGTNQFNELLQGKPLVRSLNTF
jgi:deoxyribose-phosphate aldolase